MKKFVDDISVLAIEQPFICKLPNLFSAEQVSEMTPEEISRLASESQETVDERVLWKEKHEVLKTGLRELRRFAQQVPVEPGKLPKRRCLCDQVFGNTKPSPQIRMQTLRPTTRARLSRQKVQ